MGTAAVTLTYIPVGGGAPVAIASTRNPAVLDVMKQALLTEASDRADQVADLDPGLAAIEESELVRLQRILALLLPSAGSHLRLVDSGA